MKTFVRFEKMMLVLCMLIISQFAFPQGKSGPGNGGRSGEASFDNPTLKSGNALQLGAVYQFNSVITGGIDATISIDSLVGGATVTLLDDNTSGVGYQAAFQPQVNIPGNANGAMHEAYAVFTVSFSKNSNSVTLENMSVTALDIDGNSSLKEFAEIDMGGGSASFMSTTPDLSVTNLLSLLGRMKFRADNILGIERNGIDTSALGNMFTVTNSNINSLKIKYGAKSTQTAASSRQFSLYMRGFAYPNQITLPVKLVDFTAKYDKPNVSLSWKSAQELDFNYYELEHSSDGQVFSTTSIVFGAGANGQGAEYIYTDKSVAKSGLVYYRLKMVDIDGKFTYSPVRIIRLGDDNNSLTLTAYPNPVTNELRITLPTAWQGKQVNISLYNTTGQRVSGLNIENSSQTETITTTSLQRGAYFLKANCGQDVVSRQIIKN